MCFGSRALGVSGFCVSGFRVWGCWLRTFRDLASMGSGFRGLGSRSVRSEGLGV